MRNFKNIFCLACVLQTLLLGGLLSGCDPVNDVRPPEGTEPDSINPHATEPDSTVTPKDTADSADRHRDLAYLFDNSKLPVITVTVTEDNWNRYLANFDANENNSEYVPASWRYEKDGSVWERDSVGLRPRGNTSRVRPEGSFGEVHRRTGADWHHAHFGIRFTKYATGERFFGADRVILKWHKCDPMYCREVYCYDLFHRFGVWSAPRSCYCRLYLQIDGDPKSAYFGVYELVENPRKGWMHDHFKEGRIADEEGNLWKAAWGATLSDANASMGVSDDNNQYVYDLKTNKSKLASAKQELQDFINGMTPLKSGSTELQQWLEEHMDVDLFLRTYAVSVMTGMWDDYWLNSNNYYFYFDSNHRFYFIPFDYDNTLGTDGMNVDPGRQDMLNWGSRGGDRILMRKVLSIKEFEDRYKQYIKDLAAGDFAKTASQQRIRQWHQMISPYVVNDTGEDCEIYDAAAWWGDTYGYHLLSDDNNFFTVKAASIYW